MSNMDIYASGEYLSENPDWHADDSPWKAAAVEKMLARHRLTPATIAEIGCGSGEILVELSKRLAADVKYYGYEISPQAYSICRSKTTPRISFELVDLLSTDKTHDMTLAMDVFEHVPDYLGFLTELRKRSPRHLFHVPLDFHVSSALRTSPLKIAREKVGHLHYFTKDTALASLSHCGYKVVDWFYTAGTLETKDAHRRFQRNLLRLPRKLLYGMNPGAAARILGGFSILVLAE